MFYGSLWINLIHNSVYTLCSIMFYVPLCLLTCDKITVLIIITILFLYNISLPITVRLDISNPSPLVLKFSIINVISNWLLLSIRFSLWDDSQYQTAFIPFWFNIVYGKVYHRREYIYLSSNYCVYISPRYSSRFYKNIVLYNTELCRCSVYWVSIFTYQDLNVNGLFLKVPWITLISRL